MIELLIDSLTLNSIGLFVLGIGFIVNHFWKKKKWSKSDNIAIIDGVSDSFLFRLFKIKFLIIGFGFIVGSIVLGRSDYERSVMDRNSQVLMETLSSIEFLDTNSDWMATKFGQNKEAVRIMEMKLTMSILEKQNSKSIEKWYESTQGLNRLKKTNVPICVLMYEIYYEVADVRQLEKLDKMYGDLYKDYWGNLYEEKKERNRVFWQVVEEVMEEKGYSKAKACYVAPIYIKNLLRTGTIFSTE